jgi:fatty acid desaturase
MGRLRTKFAVFLYTFAVVMLVTVPMALGRASGGEGWYGETNDKVITNAMFITIAFFPAVIVLFSLIQWWLDRRKHARTDAAMRRATNVDWRGGW